MEHYTQEQIKTIKKVVSDKGPGSLLNNIKAISAIIGIYGKDSIQAKKLVFRLISDPDKALAIQFLHDTAEGLNR